jgi:DNA-binding beta-propeller fold protein YncE
MGKRNLNSWLVAVSLIAQLTVMSARTAEGKALPFIPAPNRTDMVCDSHAKVLYITSGSSVLRYVLKTRKFLSPIKLGGNLVGIDLSPDGKTLAVADTTAMSLNLITLKGLKVTKLPIDGSDEVGLYDVAWGSDNMVYTTGSLPPGYSGWVWMRKVDPASGIATFIGNEIITNFVVLRASPDRSVIGFAQGDISDGRWGAIDVKTGTVTMRDWYVEGTSWFNYDIAVSSHGTQFSLPTYGGMFVYDDTFANIGTLGKYSVQYFDGAAYSPKDGNLYAAEAGTDIIDVYNGTTLMQMKSLQVGVTFPGNGNGSFSNGTIRFSRDGSVLFVSVPNGIEYLKLP